MENYDLSEFFSDNSSSFVHVYGALNTADLPAAFKNAIAAASLLSSDTKKIVSTFSVTRHASNGKMVFSVPGLGRDLDEHDIRDRWNGSIHGPGIGAVSPPDRFSVLRDFFGNLGVFHSSGFKSAYAAAVSDFESNVAVQQAKNLAALNAQVASIPIPTSQEDLNAILIKYSITPDYITPQTSLGYAWITRDNTNFNPNFLFTSVTNHLAAMNGCWSIRLKDASKCKVMAVTCNQKSTAANANSSFEECQQCADYLGINNTTAQLSGTGNNWGAKHCPDLSINSTNSYHIYHRDYPKKGSYNNLVDPLSDNFYKNLYPGLPSETTGRQHAPSKKYLSEPAQSDPCAGNSPTDSCGGPGGSACSPFLFNVQPGTTLKCFHGNFWLAMADMFPGTFYSKSSDLWIWLSIGAMIILFFLFYFLLFYHYHKNKK